MISSARPKSIEGKHGLLVGYSDNAHPDMVTAGLGTIYETMKVGVKPYPSCRYTHAALDALIAMRREHNLTPDQIRRVEIGLHRNGITLTGDAATKRHPSSIVGGQFSMFFTGAVALDQGRFGWDDYGRLGDAAIDALADKFDVVQDDRLEIGRTHPFGARVSITTDDGVHERLYPDPSGEPNSFPDAQAMQQKFLTLARPVLNNRAEQFADAILSLERFDRVAQATQLGRQSEVSPQLPASLPLPPVAATTSLTSRNTPSDSGGQLGDRPSRTMTSRSEGTTITYCPIVPLAKKASRGIPRAIR